MRVSSSRRTPDAPPYAPTRLGYLVPEFPGQTHIMFWRELAALRDRGAEVDQVTTRVPPASLRTHEWSEKARRATVALHPLGPAAAAAALARVVGSGPRAWRTATRAVVASEARGRARLRLLGAALLGARLAVLARRRGWEHLHVHSSASSADVARFARIFGGCTYSLTLHGPVADYGPDQRAKWGAAAFGIVITEPFQRQLEDAVDGALPETVARVGMGVGLAQLRRPAPYQPWPGTGAAELFSCGRLNPAKGHADLIRAVGHLRSAGLAVRCHIAGEDEDGGEGYRRVLEALVAEHGLEEQVVLLGAVPDREVRDRLHAAHVFVLASLAEPFGVAVMEAMAAGLPVVVTAAGGNTELVTDGVDGLLVPPGDGRRLAGAVERVLREPELARRLATGAARTAGRRAVLPDSAEVLLDLVSRSRTADGQRA